MTHYAVDFRGRPACPCLAAWLPWYEKVLLDRGVIRFSIDIAQLIGGAAESGGTHASGGAYDVWQHDPMSIAVARQMGAAAWARTAAQGFDPHQHGVLINCPHNTPARYQIDALRAGYNGLGSGGRGGRDDGPRPLPERGWKEGIEWAKAQLAPKPAKPTPAAPKPRADLTIAHCSGLWDAPVETWQEAVAAMRDAKATVVTLTETTRDGIVRAVTPKGWRFDRLDDQPGQSECSIMWAKRAWDDAGQAYPTRLARTRFKTSKGFLRPPVTAITKPLRHKKTGQVVLFTTLHAPSGVQGKTGFKGTQPRLVAHREAVEAIHEAWGQGKDAHPDAARVLTGDFNVDYRLPWVREWWGKEFPLLTPCWEGDLPERGTHGHRVIDWAAASPQLVAVSAWVLPTVDGFDHRPLVVRYAVKP